MPVAPRVPLVLGDEGERDRDWQEWFVQSSTAPAAASVSLFRPPEGPTGVWTWLPSPELERLHHKLGRLGAVS